MRIHPFQRLALAVLAAGLLLPTPTWGGESGPNLQAKETEQPVKKVKVLAQRFRFNPSKIEVDAGTRLVISLRSKDTFHGFAIEGADVDVVVPARGQGDVVVVFDAQKPGKYPFKCSKVCGAGHAQMRGMIVVAPNSPDGGTE